MSQFFFALAVFIFTLRICVAAFGRNDSYFWWLVSLGVSFFAITIRTRWCEWRRYPLLVCAPLFFHCFLTRYFPFFLIVVGNRHNNHIIYEHTYALFSLFAGFSVCLCSHSERDIRESEAEKEVQSVNIQAFPSRQMITKAFTFFRYKLPNPVNITLHNVVTAAAAAREYRSERCVSECS